MPKPDFANGKREPCPHCGGTLIIAPKGKAHHDGYVVAHVVPTCEAFRIAVEMTNRLEPN